MKPKIHPLVDQLQRIRVALKAARFVTRKQNRRPAIDAYTTEKGEMTQFTVSYNTKTLAWDITSQPLGLKCDRIRAIVEKAVSQRGSSR